MNKPARAAEPLFSQPVRQVVMMLVVVGLVTAGAYLASGPILSIFDSNPWLNGLIIGVFLLGVLTCFWQVGQMMRAVSWIEGFAAGRPGHEVTVPPRILAPLAALLRARGRHAGPISSSSSRSILESVATRIDEARDITRYLASLLIFLGLLGTFYGLAVTVPAVVDTIKALAPKEGETSMQIFDKLMGGLERQLGGMGTAFSSSLLGLAGSLVVGLLELFAGHGQNRFYRELEEWLTSFTRLSFAGGEGEGNLDQAMVAGVMDQMAGQVAALQGILERTDEGRAAVNTRLEGLVAAVAALTRHLEAEAGSAAQLSRIAAGQDRIGTGQDRIVAIEDRIAAGQERQAAVQERLADGQERQAAVQERLADGQDRLIAAQDRLVSLVERNSAPPEPPPPPREETPDAENRMRLRSIDLQLLRLIEEVAAGRQETMADLRGDLAELTRAVRALARSEEARRG